MRIRDRYLSRLLLFFAIIFISCKSEKKTADTLGLFKQIKLDRLAVKEGNTDSISLQSYIIRDFDSIGQEHKSVYFASDSTIMMQFINEYQDGNKIKVNWVNSKNKLVKFVKMTYDKSDRVIKSESFNPAGEFTSGFIHRWTNNGKMEEKGPIEKNKPFKPNSFYEYNDDNEFISLKEYSENDSLYGIFIWKYTGFNKNKDWTERHMLFNDTLVRIEKRYISYQ